MVRGRHSGVWLKRTAVLQWCIQTDGRRPSAPVRGQYMRGREIAGSRSYGTEAFVAVSLVFHTAGDTRVMEEAFLHAATQRIHMTGFVRTIGEKDRGQLLGRGWKACGLC